jgi:hypothetical protein
MIWYFNVVSYVVQNKPHKYYQYAVIVRVYCEVVGDFKCRSQWPCILRHKSAAAGFLGLWVWIPLGAWISVSCECCVCQVEVCVTVWSLWTQQNMKIIYFSYFHSVMTYGIIFGGNSADRNNVFKLQKRAIRLITDSSNRTSCHILFKK